MLWLPVNIRLIFRPQLAAILGLYRSSVLCGCNTWSKCWNTMEYFGGSFHDLNFHDPASCSQLLHLFLIFIFSDKISYKGFIVVLFVLSYFLFRRYLGFHRPEVFWRPYWEETVCAIAIEMSLSSFSSVSPKNIDNFATCMYVQPVC